MRRMTASSVALPAVTALAFGALGAAAFSSGAQAGFASLVTGNDTGGIIHWFPTIRYHYKFIAVEHCARYYRYAGISSIRYGEYIGFQCVYDRRFDPRKMGWPPVY